MQDGEIRKAFQRSLGKQGMKFKLGIKVNSAELKNGGVELKMEPAEGGKEEMLQADIVLVSAGGLSGLDWGLRVSIDGTSKHCPMPAGGLSCLAFGLRLASKRPRIALQEV